LKQSNSNKREYAKTLQEPEEVAAEMLWLGSYSASFINGQVIVMDGGVGVTSADYDYWVRR
jgi:NAD(P)-dependent dehydrogenase (short-subunit alcohol dehydrogenase family)